MMYNEDKNVMIDNRDDVSFVFSRYSIDRSYEQVHTIKNEN